MVTPLVPVDARFWRMLSIRWQREPLSGAGAAVTGGRWNRPGQEALYLSVDHATAVSEYHQNLVRPGTLATYEVQSTAIVDFTNPATAQPYGSPAELLFAEWRSIVAIGKAEPLSWQVIDMLIAQGADGLLFPSAQLRGSKNLVLWRWSDKPGSGAHVGLLDPYGDLK